MLKFHRRIFIESIISQYPYCCASALKKSKTNAAIINFNFINKPLVYILVLCDLLCVILRKKFKRAEVSNKNSRFLFYRVNSNFYYCTKAKELCIPKTKYYLDFLFDNKKYIFLRVLNYLLPLFC